MQIGRGSGEDATVAGAEANKSEMPPTERFCANNLRGITGQAGNLPVSQSASLPAGRAVAAAAAVLWCRWHHPL